jgi:hypothetical protein
MKFNEENEEVERLKDEIVKLAANSKVSDKVEGVPSKEQTQLRDETLDLLRQAKGMGISAKEMQSHVQEQMQKQGKEMNPLVAKLIKVQVDEENKKLIEEAKKAGVSDKKLGLFQIFLEMGEKDQKALEDIAQQIKKGGLVFNSESASKIEKILKTKGTQAEKNAFGIKSGGGVGRGGDYLI